MVKRVTKGRGQAVEKKKKKRKLGSSDLGDDAFDWTAVDDEQFQKGEEGEEGKDYESEEEDAAETADQKRIRLAKEYLQRLQAEELPAGDGTDSEQERDERAGITGKKKISERLKREVEEKTLYLHKKIAERYLDFDFDESSYRLLRGHRLSPTSLALMEDESSFFSGGKDGMIIRWDLTTGQDIQKIKVRTGKEEREKKDHEKEILALSVSSDGRYLASGGRDKLVRIWDTRSNSLIESFSGHRDVVSGLAFRMNSRMLLSSSFDRTVKHWNIDEMGYVETLYGHQSEVNAIDILLRERAVTSGRDRTVRAWKIRDESQLVFNGHSGSIDCVKMITEDYYLSGGEDGALALWHINKKKPALVVTAAHGREGESDATAPWISSIGVMRKTDLVASGSSNGEIMLWRADLEGRTMEHVASVPVKGFVNAIEFARSGRFMLAAIGQEHRLGRWERIKEAKNGVCVVALPDVGLGKAE